MPEFATPPLSPLRITVDAAAGTLSPDGPLLTRHASDLAGLFADLAAWERAVADGDPLVYTVASSSVPEIATELPQSITTIQPGEVGGELYMTRGHQHPDPQGEIYLGLEGSGGVLLYDGSAWNWIDMAPGVIGYIPPHHAHRSVNVGTGPYRFLAVYPGSAGHDYQWVVEHGMGRRVHRDGAGHRFGAY